MIFAVVAPVLILLGGGILDVTQASMRQSALQQAADAAAVGAVARASPGYVYATTEMTSTGPVPDSVTQANVQAIFNANWGSYHDTSTPVLSGASCSGSSFVCKQGGGASVVGVQSVVKVSATYSSSFLGLIGRKTIALSATSQASDNVPAYINFYMLLDNSPSMGLGATDADVANMEAATANVSNPNEKHCAFACHASSDTDEDFYSIAQSKGITMRITEVASATAQLMTTAINTESTNGLPAPTAKKNGGCKNSKIDSEFQVAIYDFGTSAYVAPGLTNVSALTDCLTQSQTDAATVDLMQVPQNDYAYPAVNGGWTYNNDEDTDLSYMLGQMAGLLGTSGAGATATAPQKVLFLVTDGLNDLSGDGTPTGTRIISDITHAQSGQTSGATWCTSMKSAGVKIAVLYTTYSIAGVDSDPTGWSQGNVSQATLDADRTALQACASPNLFYEVSPTNGAISSAMAALFQSVVASVRITS